MMRMLRMRHEWLRVMLWHPWVTVSLLQWRAILVQEHISVGLGLGIKVDSRRDEINMFGDVLGEAVVVTCNVAG